MKLIGEGDVEKEIQNLKLNKTMKKRNRSNYGNALKDISKKLNVFGDKM